MKSLMLTSTLAAILAGAPILAFTQIVSISYFSPLVHKSINNTQQGMLIIGLRMADTKVGNFYNNIEAICGFNTRCSTEAMDKIQKNSWLNLTPKIARAN